MWLVISPHLDDAVFSCGAWLIDHPGCLVLTLFAGLPADAWRQSTGWDRRSGFASAAEAIATRRGEDIVALASLEARPLHLEFVDAQYGEAAPQGALAAAIAEVLDRHRPTGVLGPLGLFHSDHLLAREATALALAGRGLEERLYEDLPYAAQPGVLQQRLADLAGDGCRLQPAMPQPRGDAVRKRAAVYTYASQWNAFGPQSRAALELPERHWTLAR
jgi:LmbE family N-acetylglucosaminyl deacetylase